MTAAGRSAGFSLIEIVVALAIAGLVSLLMLHGIGLAARGLDLLSQHADRLDQRRSLEMLLRRALANAVAIPVVAGEPGFVGRPTSLSFLTVVEDGGPGLYRMTLALDTATVTLARRLALRTTPPRGDESVLIRHARRFEIGYFGAAAPTDEPAWHRRWEGLGHLPQLVRITLDSDDGSALPSIVLRLPNAG